MNQEHMALSALRAFPITPAKITFLRRNENMVFQVVDSRAGRSYLLRIHAPLTTAFQGERLHPRAIASELLWLEALAEDTPLVLQEVRLGFLQKSIISSLWQILQRSLLSLQLGCPQHPKNRGVPL